MLSTVFAASLCIASVLGTSYTWTGLIGNNIWSEPRNWNPASGGPPGPSDSAYLAPSSTTTVLVDKDASVDTLHLASGTLRVPTSLAAATTLVVDATGLLLLDCGTNPVSTAYGNISSSNGVQFASGTMMGNWDFKDSALLNFTGAGQKALAGAKVTVAGLADCNAGATFNIQNASTLTFEKGLSLTAPIAQPAVMLGDDDCSVGGILNLNAQSRLNIQVPTNFDTIQVGQGSTLAVITSKHTIGSLTATSNSTVDFMGGVSAAITSLSSAGYYHSSAVVTIAEAASMQDISVAGGDTTFTKDVTASGVQMLSGTLIAAGLTADTFEVTQVGTIGGTGQFAVNTFKTGTQQTIIQGPTVSVAKTATLSNALLISGTGCLNVSAFATASSSGMQMGVSGQRGTTTMLLMDGTINVDNSAPTTFNQINGAGKGRVNMQTNSTWTMQSSEWNCDVAVLGAGASMSGSNTKWGFGTINATSDLTLTIDSATVDCGTVCGALSSDNTVSNFKVIAA